MDRTTIILEIISMVCLFVGCVLYLIHNTKEDDKKFGILCIIITAIGIGLFVGATNIPYSGNGTTGGEYYEDTEEYEDIELIDP